MDKNNNNSVEESNDELYLLFIDEERNKDLEKRFNSYINKYFDFNKKDNVENRNKENKENKENKTEPKVIKLAMY